jgi:hypothetical protein
MKVQVWLGIVLLIRSFMEGRIILYNTETSVFFERFDCIYYVKEGEVIPYCRHEDGTSSHRQQHRTDKCMNDGTLWSFQELLEQRISPNEVIKWSSSIEMADRYSYFYYNSSLSNRFEVFLCNCTRRGTFGKVCEYELPFDSASFTEAMEEKYKIRAYYYITNPQIPSYTQEYGDILCYSTLICNSGALCLDWRDICDRQQQCMEENVRKFCIHIS